MSVEDFARANKLRERLGKVEAAIDEVVQTGTSYALQGSHSLTRANLPDLRIERRRIVREINALLGGQPVKITEGPRYV